MLSWCIFTQWIFRNETTFFELLHRVIIPCLLLRNVLIFELCAKFISKNIFINEVTLPKEWNHHSSYWVLRLDHENYSFYLVITTDDLKVCYKIRYNFSAGSFVDLNSNNKKKWTIMLIVGFIFSTFHANFGKTSHVKLTYSQHLFQTIESDFTLVMAFK